MTAFRGRRRDEDFAAEIEAHLALERDRLMADGMDAAEAAAAAHRAFGNVTAVRERHFESTRWAWLEQLRQDLRYAARTLRHSPAFLLTTVLTLAIGLSVVTIAFSTFNAYFLRPFAVREPGSLYQIGWRAADDGGQQFRWKDYLELRRRDDLFDGVVAEHGVFVSSNGRPLVTAVISENYFDALAPVMRLGRPLGAIDVPAGDAVVLGEAAWQRLYDGNPDAIGQSIDVDGRPLAIVGVVGSAFGGLGDTPNDLWILASAYAALAAPDLTGRDQPRAFEVVGRLRPGVSPARVEASLTADVARAIGGTAPAHATLRRHDTPYPLSIQVLAVLSPVFVAFALVLAAACANVSNVMLARAAARRREIALRLALGAARGRIVRQLLAEGLVIAALAGALGLAFGAWALRGVVALVFGSLPAGAAALIRVLPMGMDVRVFAFALFAAACASAMFALVPALRASRPELSEALQGQRSGTAARSRLRSALVAAQVAVSLLLVITAMTIARNGRAVGRLDLGFDPRGVTSINIRGTGSTRLRPLHERLSADPEVGEVAVTSGNPLFVSRIVEAGPADGPPPAPTEYTFVSPEFFSVLRIPIADGRSFTPAEAASDARVAIVSAATAAAFWPGENPLGKVVRTGAPAHRRADDLPGYSTVTVVGVVRDVISGLMVNGTDAGHVYLPTSARSPHAVALLLRSRTGRLVAPATLERVFTQVVPSTQVFEALPFEDIRELQVYPILAAAWVSGGLALVALALSVAGLYGVLAYTIGQRTREIGIRLALGATARDVVALVLRQSARFAGTGAAIGLVVALVGMKVLDARVRLQALTFLDARAFVAGLAVVAIAVLVAALHPSWRATRIDPAESLRVDG